MCGQENHFNLFSLIPGSMLQKAFVGAKCWVRVRIDRHVLVAPGNAVTEIIHPAQVRVRMVDNVGFDINVSRSHLIALRVEWKRQTRRLFQRFCRLAGTGGTVVEEHADRYARREF